MMGVIAVAGGSGPVGRTIVDALVAHGKHRVVVFSRSDRPPEEHITYLNTNYDDVQGTSDALEDAGVDTIICAIGVATPDTNKAQLNLIKAAQQSKTTRRFVMSSFDMLQRQEYIDISPLARYTFEAINLLEQTRFEYTRVVNGWFLDYFGMPYWQTHLHPWVNVLNMERRWAAVPGDGSAKANFVTTQDMGKFVANMMDLGSWSKVSTIVGDCLTMNQLVEMAEQARGSKFNVAYDSLEKLKAGKISFASEFPNIDFVADPEAFYAMIHYQAGLGMYEVPTTDTLNERLPELSVTHATEVMSVWRGQQDE